MFSRLTLSATALLVLAVPALADSLTADSPTLAPRPMIFLRDSDGMVISVLDWSDGHPVFDTKGGVWPDGVYYAFNAPVAAEAGAGPVMARDGSPLSGQPVVLGGTELLAAGTGGQVLEIGGVSYRVETDGRNVWLRDIATGKRHATSRHKAQVAPDAQGLAVNPENFALD